MSFTRKLRWCLEFFACEYQVNYRKSKNNKNAASLGRLAVELLVIKDTSRDFNALLMQELDQAPVTAAQVEKWTQSDPVLSGVELPF